MLSDKKKTPEIVLLTTVTDNMTIGLIEGLLEGNDIPFFKQNRGSGGYLQIASGFSPFGTEFYVRQDQLEAAKELLEVYLGISPCS